MKSNIIIISTIVVIIFACFIGFFVFSELNRKEQTSGELEHTQNKQLNKNSSSKKIGKSKNTELSSSHLNLRQKKYVKKFRYTTDEDEIRRMYEIIDKFKRASLPDEKIDLLDELAGITHPAVIRLIVEALNDDNKDVRMEAVSLLDEFDNEDILPAVDKALDDKSPDVRELAVETLDEVNTPDANNLIVKAASDKSKKVRESALDVIEDRPPKIQEAIFQHVIKSPYQDVKQRMLDIIIDIPSHKVMDVLIEGLKDSNPEFRNQVKDIIDFFVSHEFDSYEEAKTWWEENKDKFDDELFEKD